MTTKKKFTVAAAIFLALILAFSFAAQLIITQGYTIAVQHVTLEVRGADLTMDIYRPAKVTADTKLPCMILSHGGSETARDYFVRSVKETSAVGFLADIFLSPEEVDAIVNPPLVEIETQTDTSLIEISAPPATDAEEPVADAWGYVDDDGDGLILVPIRGGSYTGYMLIVLDPSRVVVGCDPETIHHCGHSVEWYVNELDAVAGINGGGFEDENGHGNGAKPDTMVVHEGVVYCGGMGIGSGWVGIDEEYKLRVGFQSYQDVIDWNIQEGCGFAPGPILVINGEIAPEENLRSGLNPRTAIGQRSDGAILMLVIEGRQPSRLGASYMDVAEVMLRFGAVNAVNLDGGSSSMMYYNGEYINNSASVIGIRPIPTSFVVLKEGRRGND